jgi:hypothetical protein
MSAGWWGSQVMHIRQTVDKRTTGSTRASRMGGYMSSADTDAGWPLHPHISQILALQVRARKLAVACVLMAATFTTRSIYKGGT